MKRSIHLIVFGSVLVLCSGGTCAQLITDLDFKSFVEGAQCGLLVQVQAVQVLDPESPQIASTAEQERWLYVEATLSVHGRIGNCESLGVKPGASELMARFSEDVHASLPKEGERAIFFPGLVEGVLTEYSLGISYWVISRFNSMDWVEVNWRNDFLVAPVELEPGEVSYLNFPALIRALKLALQPERGP